MKICDPQASALFENGRAFAMAAGLTKAHSYEWASIHTDMVYSHLLCQAFECLGKGLLVNEEKMTIEEVKKEIGHDLSKLEGKLRNHQLLELSEQQQHLLNQINTYYNKHELRYRQPRIDNFREICDSLHEILIKILNAC